MKKIMLLAASLCFFTAGVALATEPSVTTTPQAPLAGTTASGAVVPDTSTAETIRSYSIEEIYKNAEALNKKKVVVHGQCVKVTSNIMGKNWMHLQDGTGDAAKGTNDVICVSATDRIEVGQTVTIIGILSFNPARKNKILIEDAVTIR